MRYVSFQLLIQILDLRRPVGENSLAGSIVRENSGKAVARFELILASRSNRRSRILKSCDISHTVITSDIKEDMDFRRTPVALVITNARRKAIDVAEKLKRKAVVLGVDTVVYFKRVPIGKPHSKKEALELLKSFSGDSILVYTGLCLVDKYKNKVVTGSDRTKLKVKNIFQDDISKYFALLKPYDKAGGFSIEGIGSILFDNLEGSYFNVLGLPMVKLEQLFRKSGYNILDFVGK